MDFFQRPRNSHFSTLQWRSILALRAVLVCAAIGIGLYVINGNFFPFGTWRYTYFPGEDSKFIDEFASKEPYALIGKRNNAKGEDSFQLITVDPVYATVRTPRAFSKVKTRLFFRNPDQQQTVNIGFFEEQTKSYRIRNMVTISDVLESLRSTWDVVYDGDVALFQKRLPEWSRAQIKETAAEEIVQVQNSEDSQKETQIEDIETKREADLNAVSDIDTVPKYETVDEFIQSLGTNGRRTALYNYDFENTAVIPDYVASPVERELGIAIRGKHTLYTYIKDEPLFLVLTSQDINRHEGEDSIKIRVSFKGTTVFSQTIEDDGNANANGVVSEPLETRIELPDLEEGVYKIELSTNDDVFFYDIVTKQKKLVFRDRVYLAGNSEYASVVPTEYFKPTPMMFEGSRLTGYTSHPAGLQKASINNAPFDILTVAKPHTLDMEFDTAARLRVPANDLTLTADGFFALSEQEFFKPYSFIPRLLNRSSNLNSIDYILAKYPEVAKEGEWLVAEQTEENPPYTKDGEMKMIINVPQLSESGKVFHIHKIEFEFTKQAWNIRYLMSRLREMWNKILP